MFSLDYTLIPYVVRCEVNMSLLWGTNRREEQENLEHVLQSNVWCECYIRETGLSHLKHVANRFVNIPRRRVVELSNCLLEQQLLTMFQHGLQLWRATLKRHPMSGRDGKLKTIPQLLAARLAPRSVESRIRLRVRRRNPKYHMHPSLVRYLQLSTMHSYWMTASSDETVLFNTWIIKAIPTTFVRSSSSRTNCPIDSNSSCCWKTSNFGCHKGNVNRPGATWTFWGRHGGDWESRTYVHAINQLNRLTIIFSLARSRSAGCRYSLAAWIFYESTG